MSLKECDCRFLGTGILGRLGASSFLAVPVLFCSCALSPLSVSESVCDAMSPVSFVFCESTWPIRCFSGTDIFGFGRGLGLGLGLIDGLADDLGSVVVVGTDGWICVSKLCPSKCGAEDGSLTSEVVLELLLVGRGGRGGGCLLTAFCVTSETRRVKMWPDPLGSPETVAVSWFACTAVPAATCLGGILGGARESVVLCESGQGISCLCSGWGGGGLLCLLQSGTALRCGWTSSFCSSKQKI